VGSSLLVETIGFAAFRMEAAADLQAPSIFEIKLSDDQVRQKDGVRGGFDRKVQML
jgi:hypothetical protein